MVADDLVGIRSFDEAVCRIIAVACEPASRSTEGDLSTVPTELQIRRCLDELLSCYELRTQEFLSEARHKQLQQSHQIWQRRADLIGKVAVDKVKQTEQELAARERDLEERRQDMDVLNHRLESREAALAKRELTIQAHESNFEDKERKDMDAINHRLEARETALAKRETSLQTRESNIEDGERKSADVLNHKLKSREDALSKRELGVQVRESNLEAKERKDMDALNHRLDSREEALSKRELAVEARESNLEDRERKDMDMLNHRLESREAGLSKRELALRTRESNLEDRERNVAVHELKVEEERRLVAESDRAQREAAALHQRQIAEQRARCAEAERKLGERSEALAVREQSVANPGADAQRLSKPPAPPEAGGALAAWEARLASRDRALAESRRDQEAQERMLRERERHLGDVDAPQAGARALDPAPRLAAPAALPPPAHHSRPGSFDSSTLTARGASHDPHFADLNSAAAGQKNRKTARKRVHDNGVSDAALLHERGPAEGGSMVATADMDLGAHDPGPSSKRHAAEPHRVTSAFARFAGPLTRLLGGSEAPTSMG